jgi:hypothetical protein
MTESFFSRFVNRFFGAEIERRVSLAVRALDDSRDRLVGRSSYPRDRYGYKRDEALQEALEMWRVNPLARRIVGLTTQYVVGGGIGVEVKHERINKFIQDWWSHRLNRMPMRVYEWCDELTRSGELFVVVSTDPAGMSYLRAVPAADIQDIETTDNDLEQEVFIYEKPEVGLGSRGAAAKSAAQEQGSWGVDGLVRGRKWKVYDENTDGPEEDGTFQPVMLHYAINRPVGAKFGESDLAPLLPWLARYASWLQDRARLNTYRQSFIYTVKAKFDTEADRRKRQAELNMDPPNPGTILVVDSSEEWSVLAPNLSSFEAAADGLALKKIIAAGCGAPLHFLAEPESATRTTAESAGGPTFRHYEQRQEFFLWMIADLTRVVLRRRKFRDRLINPRADIEVSGTDISSRDNAALATAASTIIGAFLELRELGFIDDHELIRIAYRFAGEVADVEDLLKRGKAAPKITRPGGRPGASGKNGAGRPPGIRIDPIDGQPKNIDKA